MAILGNFVRETVIAVATGEKSCGCHLFAKIHMKTQVTLQLRHQQLGNGEKGPDDFICDQGFARVTKSYERIL